MLYVLVMWVQYMNIMDKNYFFCGGFVLFIGSAPNLLRFIPQHLIVQSQQALRHNAKSLGHHNFATENGILQSIHPHCNNMNFRTGFQVSAFQCQNYWCSHFNAKCSSFLLGFVILVGYLGLSMVSMGVVGMLFGVRYFVHGFKPGPGINYT